MTSVGGTVRAMFQYGPLPCMLGKLPLKLDPPVGLWEVQGDYEAQIPWLKLRVSPGHVSDPNSTYCSGSTTGVLVPFAH